MLPSGITEMAQKATKEMILSGTTEVAPNGARKFLPGIFFVLYRPFSVMDFSVMDFSFMDFSFMDTFFYGYLLLRTFFDFKEFQAASLSPHH